MVTRPVAFLHQTSAVNSCSEGDNIVYSIVLSSWLQLRPVSPASPEQHLDTNLSWQRSTHVSDCHDSIGPGARLQCTDLRRIVPFLLGICLGHTNPLFRFGDQIVPYSR